MIKGTRLIFWVDMIVLVVVAFLVIRGQWDFVIALGVALVMVNYFDHLMNRRSRR